MASDHEHIFFNSLPDFEKEAEEEKRLRKIPKAPSFSLDDMEDARKSAFDKGHTAGLEMAKDSIEQQTEILIQSLTSRIQELENAEEQRHDNAIKNAISIAEKSMQHLLPAIIDRNGYELILNSLKTFFEEHTAKADMTLFVNPDLLKPIEKHIQNLSPTLALKPADSLSATQTRLEWTDGIYEFKPDIMVGEILNIIKQYSPNSDDLLDDLAQTTHTKDNNEEQQDT